MQKKIVFNFTTGKVTTYGAVEERHLDIAKAKLHFREVEPCRFDKLKRKVKKFFRCLTYALSSKEPPKHIVLRRPIMFEGVVHGND